MPFESFDINNKVAIITGGASGIGLKYAEELLRNGLKAVTLADINDDFGKKALQAIEKEFGADKAIFAKTDVCEKTDLENAFRKTINTFKHLDIVINNAGVLNDAAWEKEVVINVIGTIHGTLLAMEDYIPKYKSGNEGVVVNVSSVAGLDPFPPIPVYGATKFAVQGLSRSFGSEQHYERTKVRVLAICPGVTDTPLVTESDNRNLGEPYQSLVEKMFADLPIQPAEDVARAMIKIIKEAKTGTVWMVEDRELCELEFPSRKSLKKQ